MTAPQSPAAMGRFREIWARHERLDLLLVAATAVVAVLLWFRGSALAFGSDLTLPFHPDTRLGRFLYSYNPWLGTGSQNPTLYGAPDFVETVGFYFLQTLGGIQPAQMVYLALVYALGAVSVYLLTRWMIRGEAYGRVSGFVASGFFLFNPFLFGDNYTQIVATAVPRAAFPLFLALLLQGLRTGQLRYAAALGVTSFLVAITFPIEQYAIFAGVIGVMVALAYLLLPSSPATILERLRNRWKFLLASLGLIVASNLYILWYLVSLFGLLVTPYQGFAPNLEVGTSLDFSNSMRLFGAWPFFSDYGGIPYVPYSAAYLQSPVLIALGFAVPILAFSAVFLRPGRYSVRLMTLLALGTVFLAKNYHPPLGDVFGFLVGSLPGFKLFYGGWPFIDLGATEYATLVGITVGALAERAARAAEVPEPARRAAPPARFPREGFAALTVVLVFAVLLCISWPLVTGDVAVNWVQPDQRGIAVPSDYESLNAWLQSSDPNGRVFILPALGTYFATTWGYQGTSAFYQTVLENPVVQTTSGEYNIGRDESAALIQSAYVAATQLFVRPPDTLAWDAAWALPTWTLVQSPGSMTDSLASGSVSGSPVLIWTIHDTVVGQDHVLSLPWSGSMASLQVIDLNLSQPTVPDVLADRLMFGVWDANQSLGEYLFTSAQMTSEGASVTALFKVGVPDDGAFDPAQVRSFSFRYVGAGDGSTWQLSLRSLSVAAAAPNAERLASLLTVLGVRHVLLDMSTATSLYPGTDLATPGMALSQTAWFAPERIVGFLRLYSLIRVRPLLGAATHVVYYNASSEIPDLAEALSATAGSVAVNLSLLSSGDRVALQGLGPPPGLFLPTVQSPTVFEALYNSTSPFILTLDLGYTDVWSVQVDGMPASPIHIVVDGYANGWVLTQTGRHALRVTYARQLSYSAAFDATMAVLGIEVVGVAAVELNVPNRLARRRVH